ncbi:unnamed protein product [Nippostrongylus brasiliensis]|uniref:SAC domain-containing protein n=1 Tax=Nippostrongylus brasiliensis TaxID=27835 RepID=A0A0N4YBK0_NIPBR|nr:unnamed protein product [Nippostrongylus brasiliensis]
MNDAILNCYERLFSILASRRTTEGTMLDGGALTDGVRRKSIGRACSWKLGIIIGEILEEVNVVVQRPRSIPPSGETLSAVPGRRSPPLASPENDSEFQLDIEVRSKKNSQVASASSGYGSSSASSESEQEISEQVSLTESVDCGRVSRIARKARQTDRWRRRTVAVSLFSDDVMRILQSDGHAVIMESDASLRQRQFLIEGLFDMHKTIKYLNDESYRGGTLGSASGVAVITDCATEQLAPNCTGRWGSCTCIEDLRECCIGVELLASKKNRSTRKAVNVER